MQVFSSVAALRKAFSSNSTVPDGEEAEEEEEEEEKSQWGEMIP